MSNEQTERHAERSRGISPATTTPFVNQSNELLIASEMPGLRSA
jgi:hypothetical protein